MWLFYCDNSGWIPMGNDGQMKVPARISTRKLHQLAEALLSGRAGRIYLMTSWTQQMSELGPRAFEEYIQRNGKVVVHS